MTMTAREAMIRKALEARQDATEAARKLQEDGAGEKATNIILEALRLLDTAVVRLGEQPPASASVVNDTPARDPVIYVDQTTGAVEEHQPLPNTSDEERVRDLAQRMIGRWNGPTEMLLGFLRLLLRSETPASATANVPKMHVAIVTSDAGEPYVKLEYTEPDFGGSRTKGRYACYLLAAAPKDGT